MGKILFPTDFSDTAKRAFQLALHLADAINTKIDLIHVYHLPIGDASNIPPDMIEGMIRENEEAALQEMKEFVKDANPERIGEIRIDYGVFIASEITEAAADDSYQLIMMGTKGKHNRMEQFLGSVTSQTFLHAPCPVIAIPEDSKVESIKKVAYASEFRPLEGAATDDLAELVEQLGAELDIVHVDGDIEDNQEVQLDGMSRPVTMSVLKGKSVTEAIEQFVEEKNVDMLALYKPRRKFIERVFHPSLTKRMAFHSKVPLFIFRD